MPPESPVLPSSAVQGQAPTLATSPPTMRMMPLTTLLSTTLDTPHVTGAGVVVVVVVVDVVVEVVLVAQHRDMSLPSKPHGLLMAARRYLRMLLVTPCLMIASSTGLQSPEEMN